jgi:hypothetical protein
MPASCTKQIAVVLFALTLVAASPSYAQTVNLHTSQVLFAVPETGACIRPSLATSQISDRLYSNRTTTFARQTTSQPRHRSVKRKILGGAIGGVGGFFGGGYLGAAIEGDRCNCDDPGLMGALIGAPVGAAIGAILGVKFF